MLVEEFIGVRKKDSARSNPRNSKSKDKNYVT